MSLAAFGPEELRTFTKLFEDLFDAGDPAAMTSYYTEDAQLMAEGMALVQGHDAITGFWRTAMARATAAGAGRAIQLHESHTSGDLGYALCTVTVALPHTSIASWDATIWRRDPHGAWRIAVDISAHIVTDTLPGT